ncbi:MAG: ABC transporter permease [Deltaproteobacteria bacterium]|nr:ABC transporter permease [Deltaproteobacteria bacterium]
MSALSSRIATAVPAILVAATLLAAWHIAVVASGAQIIPSPVAVAKAIGELQANGTLLPHIGASLGRVVAGYLLAVVIGVPIGFLMGMRRELAVALNPAIQFLRPISPLAWLPVAVVLLGIGNAAAIMLIFLASFFAVIMSSMNAVGSVREVHLRVGRSFGLSPRKLLTRILLPSAMPQLLVGLRMTLGIAWLVVVAAEMLGVRSGLGYLVIDARNAGKRYDLVVAAMVCIGVIGFVLDFAMRLLEKALTGRWRNAV